MSNFISLFWVWMLVFNNIILNIVLELEQYQYNMQMSL